MLNALGSAAFAARLLILAFLACLFANPANADTLTGRQITGPIVPGAAMNFDDGTGRAVPVSAANPLPVTFPSPQGQSIQPVSQSGTWNLNNVSGVISLPTGASTLAAQNTGNASLATIATNTTGAATAAKQDTANGSLASIDSKLTSPITVQGSLISSSWALTQFFAGKCFSFAIPLTQVAVGNYLNVTLTNPAGSGETFIVLERRFSQTTANVLAYNYFVNPGAISGTVTTKSGSNQLTSSSNTSALSLNYAVSTTAMTGTAVGAMPIPPNGVENPPIALLRSISPGTSIGYQMGGTGGVLTAASQFTFTLEGCKQ